MSDTTQTVRSLIMELVPVDGTRVGNQAFIAELGERVPEIDEVEYHAVKNELVGEGLLPKGRCRGGPVCRLDRPAVEAASVASTADKPKTKTVLMND